MKENETVLSNKKLKPHLGLTFKIQQNVDHI